jgi:N-acetyl-anhydromuramyl-L-alanine amidase AmpD/methionine-rich copper-binding protein CopC
MKYLRRFVFVVWGLTCCSGMICAQTEDRSKYHQYFDAAAVEFGVPADVLRGVAFSTTRWSQLTWAEGDTVSACTRMPRLYGIMGLWDNDEFGHTLREAAALIGRDVQELKTDPYQNIRGGAALLKKLYNETPAPAYASPTSVESWENAIARYTGIPQPELSHQHVLELFTRLQTGYHQFGIDIDARAMNLEPIRQTVKALQQTAAAKAQASRLNKTANTPDYPLAKWVPGTPDCYYTSGNGKVFVVIHDMEGYYAAVVSGFQTRTDASVHYCLNSAQDNASDSPAGEITQMVEEQYYAWHAKCLNSYSLGIEHEGFANNPAWFTDAMYLSSAKLVKYMCDKYNIPKDKNHIVAHGEWQNNSWVNWIAANYPAITPSCNNHTDPGPYWDWSFYMQMIRQDTTVPHVSSTPPTAAFQVYDKIHITFSERMDRASVEKNFSILPNVSGSFVWETDNRTMTFSPNTYLTFNAQYTVAIDTGAHNYFGKGLDANADGVSDRYTFTFNTVKSDLAAPTVTQSYPKDKQTAISPSAAIRITFSEVMDASTLAGAIVLKDSTGTVIPTTNTIASPNGTTLVIATPVAPLLPNATYTLQVTQDAKDLSANILNAPQSYAFTTGSYPKILGTVLSNLDAPGGWWQPSASGSTVNVISSFQIVASPKFNGTGAGMISYAWANASGGVCREHNSSALSVEGGTIVGIWVYGDNSGNNLELWFYYASTYTAVAVGTIDWTGWKLITIPVSSIPAGNRRFASFVIKQVAGAAMTGAIYIDDLTVGTIVTDVSTSIASAVPASFNLEQNYPNPFNPSTHIQFSLPSVLPTRLSVYDILGREVAQLVNETLQAGTYTIEWNARNIPSGVYFYTLRAGNFSQSKKLLLSK